MNPAGTDAGNEWIELYNDGEISLEGYIIINGDRKNISLNDTFNGYFVYTFTKQWLDNFNESISLYNGLELIDKTDLFDDSKNDDLTHQFCSFSWKFMSSTKGSENNCLEETQEETQPTTNETTEQTDDNSTMQETSNNPPKSSSGSTTSSPKSTTKTITLAPIALNIKSEDNKEILKRNLALAGIVSFCIGFGALFLLKTLRRKKENEFR